MLFVIFGAIMVIYKNIKFTFFWHMNGTQIGVLVFFFFKILLYIHVFESLAHSTIIMFFTKPGFEICILSLQRNSSDEKYRTVVHFAYTSRGNARNQIHQALNLARLAFPSLY